MTTPIIEVHITTYDDAQPTVQLTSTPILEYVDHKDLKLTGRWQIIKKGSRVLLYLEVEYTTIMYTENFAAIRQDREIKFIYEDYIRVLTEHHYPIQSCS
jgi:hypothetical protein